MDPLPTLRTALAERYAVERELGRGGMATVYLARDLRHERQVAIKVLRPELAAALGAERFLQEVKITAQLHHPHILQLFDSGEAGGLLYYLMPYVEGESLHDRLARDAPLPVDDALRITREVADALSYAHSRGVVHRDIKPGNIMLSAGHALVTDFGIARAITAAGGERLTRTGLSVGTPAYMSPEQAAGERELDARTDVYSLGCVLYEMLTGEPPFTGASVVSQHLTEEPRPVTTARPQTPPRVAAALDRALAKLPADRFATAEQFADRLEGPTPAPEPSAAPPARRPAAGWLAAAALAAVVLGAAAWWLLAPRDRAPVRGPAATMAVMPFAPAVEDSALVRLGRELAITLSANLDGVGGIATADPMTVLNRADAATGRTLGDAAVMAQALGAGSVVHGTVVRAGDAVRLDAGLYDAGDLAAIARVSVTGPPDDLTVLTDSATWRLLEQIWHAGDPPSPSLAAVTTRSIPALRAFLAGERAMAENRFRDAAGEFQQAIGRDSTFWFAYWRFAYVRGWHGESVDSAIRDAYWEHRAAFPERDRLLIEAGRLATDRRDYLARLQVVTERYPTYWPAWLMYQDQLVHGGGFLGYDYADSRAALERLRDLNPGLLPALSHLGWVVAYQRDSTALAAVIRDMRRYNYAAQSGDGAVGDFGLFLALEALVRSGGALPEEAAARDAAMLVSAPARLAAQLAGGNLSGYEFHAAQITMARAMRAAAPGPEVAAEQWRAIAVGWAGRGAWDSALGAADRYAATGVAGPEGELFGQELAAVGAWLGGVEPARATAWAERTRPLRARLAPAARAQAAWLDGLLAYARQDGAGIQAARRAVEQVSGDPWTPVLARSLGAYARDLQGDVSATAELRAAEDTVIANGLQGFGGAHPWVNAVNRLLLGRRLRAAGDLDAAERTLRWYQVVYPGRYHEVAVANRVVAAVAYFERARVAAAAGDAARAAGFYERFLSEYDAPVPALEWMAQEARGFVGSGR